MNNDQLVELTKKLIAQVQGAPYPETINKELYSIWFEHASISANEALEFINENQLLHKPDATVIPD